MSLPKKNIKWYNIRERNIKGGTMKEYLSFISNEDLMDAISNLHFAYESTMKTTTTKDFYKNKVDPIKLLFDTKFNYREIEETIELEIVRKKDKTISNAIGTFHEEILGSIEGFKQFTVGHGYDIKSDDDSFFADVKNKHNTVKGSNLKDLYQELETYIKASGNPKAKAYWVQIIAMNSFNEPWRIPINKLNNPNIYKISADRLYQLMTGIDDSFKQLCAVLPVVIDDYLKTKEKITKAENIIVEELTKEAKANNTSLILELFNQTFGCYIGFPIKDDTSN